LDNLTPITKQQFEKWVPKKIGDLSLTTSEYGKLPKGQKNKNNIRLDYANNTKNKKIELYVVDAAKHPDDMEMVNFMYAIENDKKAEKDIKPYVSQYNKENINAEALWEYIKKLEIEKLLKKPDTKTVKLLPMLKMIVGQMAPVLLR